MRPITNIRRKPVVAILCADLHFSATAPLCRKGEPDWLATQEKYLNELKTMAWEMKCPVVCAGDIFHKHSPPVWFVNWVSDRLPCQFLSIPGNHDLPNHQMSMIDKCGFGALYRMGTLQRVPVILEKWYGDVMFRGRPLNGKIPTVAKRRMGTTDQLNVLLTHEYVHTHGTGYPGAENPLTVDSDRFGGNYNVVVVGDNHIPFTMKLANGTLVVNCGALFVRTVTDTKHKQYVWLLHIDGTVTPKELVSAVQDAPYGAAAEKITSSDKDIEEFVETLVKLRANTLDYRIAMVNALKGMDEGTRNLVLTAMEAGV